MEQNQERLAEHQSFKETRELLRELKVNNVADQFSNRVVTLIIASLGLTTALAWDDTLHELFYAIFGHGDHLSDKLFYSVSVTLVAVIVTLVLARALRKHDKN